ncbi:hypothetical protein C8D88_102332 [Lentzea atacamensis]|uniref:Uncharacterized protein n=1 Tax=Lentzea atacamensis TaxID=531938 RepID=A0A316I733_9PSEU|nr:hypothetical protein [Lentzea atacamensis]PWK89061.1 hypothetical protein C8D88_102332 [Lentzea atacamensis]
MTGRSLGVAAAIAAAITLGAMTTVPASAEPAGNTIIELKNVARGQCMTASTIDPFLVEMAGCTGAANQRWERVPAAGNQFFLRNVADRKCIRGEGSLTGEECDDTDRYQRWELAPDPSGAVKLKVAVAWPWYADTSWYDSEFNFGIITEDSQDSDHQRWLVAEAGRMPVLPDTTGALVTLESSQKFGRCPNGVATGDCPGSAFQRVELGGGVIGLRTPTGCLRAAPDQHYDNVVDLRGDCAAADTAQQWRLEGPDAFGGYRLRNVDRGKYLMPLVDRIGHFPEGLFGKAPQMSRWIFHLA